MPHPQTTGYRAESRGGALAEAVQKQVEPDTVDARGRWARWVAVLDHREPATALALTRIGLGLVTFWSIASVWWAGLAPLLWFDVAHGGYRHYSISGSWLVAALGGPDPQLILALTVVGLAGSAALALGVWGRVSAFVALQCFLALAWVNPHTGGSYDHLISNALWLLVLAKSDQTLSVSARWRTGRWTDPTPVPAWPRYLMVGQLAVMYASTGFQKVSAHWLPGGDLSALYYILQQPSWRRMNTEAAAWVYPLTQLATLTTWLFEVGGGLFVLALYFRHTRTRPGRLRALANRVDLRSWMVGFGLLLHVGIHISMDVGPFSAAAVSMYWCAFHPDELRALTRRVWPGRTRRAAPSRP